MSIKDKHPVRKAFRLILLLTLACAAIFFATIVALRIMGWSALRGNSDLRDAIFYADTLQYKAVAAISDDVTDMQIIRELFQNGIFSPIYSEAGFEMLNRKVEQGHPEAIELQEKFTNYGIRPEI